MGRLHPWLPTLRLLSIMILLTEHHFRECLGELIEKLYLRSQLKLPQSY
jgi:hypothetical protein